MDLVAAPYLAAALLLVIAGVTKARDPLTLTRALQAAGLRVRGPVLARLVRAGAVLEAGIGVAAVGWPDRALAYLVAASYAGFTLFVLRALRADSPLASCGCFGKADTPPTWTHVVVTAGLTLAALAAPADRLVTDVPLLVVTGVLAYLTYLTLAVRPLVPRR